MSEPLGHNAVPCYAYCQSDSGDAALLRGATWYVYDGESWIESESAIDLSFFTKLVFTQCTRKFLWLVPNCQVPKWHATKRSWPLELTDMSMVREPGMMYFPTK